MYGQFVPSVLLVIPFYSKDRGQVERLGKWMRALSGGERIGEKLLFCATESTDPQGIGVEFVGLFDQINAIKQTFGAEIQPGERSWPKSPNFQFCHTAKYIHENRPDVDAFYYMEPDNLPIDSKWFSKLCADYEKQSKPFYGVKSSYVGKDGKTRWEDGDHMIGTGFYPQDSWARIKGYEKIQKEQPSDPWDAITRDEVNPHCHFTDLIINVHGSRGWREDEGKLSALYRLNSDPTYTRRPVVIPSECVVIHGCKDSSLRLLMAKELALQQNDTLTFAHSGDLGDMIWALPSIKEKGGGILQISSKGLGAREPMTDERINLIRPLLTEQNYIFDVEQHDGGYVDFDFSRFRVIHKRHSNLLKDQADWVGEKIDGSKPWLTVPAIKPTGQVIVNRTKRYHNEEFPWEKIYREYGAAMRFVGLKEEHQDFEKEIGSIDYLATSNLLETAKLIAASRLFVGNQSVCNAINEGLKHPGIQESCPECMDCVFPSKDIVYYSNGQLDVSAVKDVVSANNSKDIFKSPEFKSEVRRLALEVLKEQLG